MFIRHRREEFLSIREKVPWLVELMISPLGELSFRKAALQLPGFWTFPASILRAVFHLGAEKHGSGGSLERKGLGRK